MRKTIYLAGLISTDYPESLLWRERVAPSLWAAGFLVVSPMAGKKNLATETKDGGLNSLRLSSKSIVLRDFNDVQKADIILAHLDSFGCPRPLLGTIAELAWAWDAQIPVVGIAAPDNALMRNHPFMREFIAQYFETEDAALEYLWKDYLGEE